MKEMASNERRSHLDDDILILDHHREGVAVPGGGWRTLDRRPAWSLLENVLADKFSLASVNLHVVNGGTTVDLRGGTLTGSELEAGIFTARELTIASPLFYKTFSNLRGATSWERPMRLIRIPPNATPS